MGNVRTLIVVEEEALSFRSHLEFNHCIVRLTHAMEDAARLLSQESFELLIVDYALTEAGLSFLDGVGHLRAQQNGADIKIIVISFKALDDDEMRKLVKSNAFFLKKPFVPSTLIRKIETLFT